MKWRAYGTEFETAKTGKDWIGCIGGFVTLSADVRSPVSKAVKRCPLIWWCQQEDDGGIKGGNVAQDLRARSEALPVRGLRLKFA